MAIVRGWSPFLSCRHSWLIADLCYRLPLLSPTFAIAYLCYLRPLLSPTFAIADLCCAPTRTCQCMITQIFSWVPVHCTHAAAPHMNSMVIGGSCPTSVCRHWAKIVRQIWIQLHWWTRYIHQFADQFWNWRIWLLTCPPIYPRNSSHRFCGHDTCVTNILSTTSIFQCAVYKLHNCSVALHADNLYNY